MKYAGQLHASGCLRWVPAAHRELHDCTWGDHTALGKHWISFIFFPVVDPIPAVEAELG